MISDQTFLSFLHCRRKAYLKAHGCPGEPADIETVQLDLARVYRRQALEEFIGSASAREVIREPSSLAVALRDRPRFIVNATATTGDVSSQIHLLERVEGAGGHGSPAYTPVLFVPHNKISRLDKLVLALNAFALTAAQEVQPPVAKIVYGENRKVLRVRIEALMREVRTLVDQIHNGQTEGRAPLVTLNRHCIVCEFHDACRKAAEETDDLSLLLGVSEKEVGKLRGRGITTVTQFSYIFRPGRRGKRKTGKARKHDPALHALAVREKKVYVLDSPQVPRSGVALYLDVEGIPDRDFYYLIGLVAVRDGVSTAYSFWADGRNQEAAIWDACAQLIESSCDYTLYHYGSYERRFFDRMAEAGGETAASVERIRPRSFNLLGAIHSHVYFPTWSNGLKDVAGFLNMKWSAPSASGAQALAWRLTWKTARDESLKQHLLLYNREDCLALRRVTEFIVSVCAGVPQGDGVPTVASIQDIRRKGRYKCGTPEFFCPELAHINECAYSDYQREKVYLRTSPAVRKSLQRKQRTSERRLKVNVEVRCGRPTACPECDGARAVIWGSQVHQRVISDLKFTASGVKRWIVRYSSLRYRCADCKKTFFADAYRTARPRWGTNLSSWAIYNHVALRQSYYDVNLSFNDIFGFSFSPTLLTRIILWAAERYKGTYDRIKDKLRLGLLIHADETKAVIRNNTGYVWAFTNLEEVVYVYTPTREADILQDMLVGFTGVLVSDFYTAYDSAKCHQQKCLIHLIRDINDDLFHNPFDDELKQIGQRLVVVLKPIIDTIDRFGLKHCHLRKHKEDVARYYRYLSDREFGPRSRESTKNGWSSTRTSFSSFWTMTASPGTTTTPSTQSNGSPPAGESLGRRPPSEGLGTT
jgi:predicted RecB family nuclease